MRALLYFLFTIRFAESAPPRDKLFNSLKETRP